MSKEDLIILLMKYDVPVIETALAYAHNLWRYGVDVTKEWKTALEQSDALSHAYIRGLEDQEKKHRGAE